MRSSREVTVRVRGRASRSALSSARSPRRPLFFLARDVNINQPLCQLAPVNLRPCPRARRVVAASSDWPTAISRFSRRVARARASDRAANRATSAAGSRWRRVVVFALRVFWVKRARCPPSRARPVSGHP